MYLNLKKTFFYSLFSAFLVLSSYFLIYLPIEFLVTEIWLMTPKVPSLVSLFFLVAFAALFVFVDWRKLLKSKWRRLVLVSAVVMSGFVYTGYRREKLAREYLPKIYEVDRVWGIQAQMIKIEGVNFFPVWKKGKVVFDGDEMVIKDWDEKLVVAEQPVPKKFGKVDIRIIRSDGVISNGVKFKIRDPKELEN